MRVDLYQVIRHAIKTLKIYGVRMEIDKSDQWNRIKNQKINRIYPETIYGNVIYDQGSIQLEMIEVI